MQVRSCACPSLLGREEFGKKVDKNVMSKWVCRKTAKTGETQGRKRDGEKRQTCKYLFTDTWAVRTCDTHDNVWSAQCERAVRITMYVQQRVCTLLTRLIVGLLLPLIIFFSLLHRLKKTALHVDKNLRLWSRNLDLTTVQHAGHVFGVGQMTRRSTPERSEGANSVTEAVGDDKREQMGSKEHSAMTWPVAKWLMDAQTNRQAVEPNV